MSNFPTLAPVIVDGGSFQVQRLLDRAGTVDAQVGEAVTPGEVVARADNVEKSFTLYLANELGVPNDSLRKYLAKSVGSSIQEGEPIARVRRGLRSASVKSPATGTIVHVDDTDGTVTLTTTSGPQELTALVHGVVEEVFPERGVCVRTEGSRVYGISGFGGEAAGQLVIGSDRNDRELTADQVSSDWQGKIVLGGMTAGVPALTRMRDAGVAGVIVGSMSESDIRRFYATEDAQRMASFWKTGFSGSQRGMVLIITEGFGRLPMAEAIYDFLKARAGSEASVTAATSLGATLARPEIHISGDAGSEPHDTTLEAGRVVRIIGSQLLGRQGTITSDVFDCPLSNGVYRACVEVELENGAVETVPVSNVEVLV